jgi:hypothetical protein
VTNPSPGYRELVALHRRAHVEGEPFLKIPADQVFEGWSLVPHARELQCLLRAKACLSVIDYGSGKGPQYSPFPFWPAEQVVRLGFDPAGQGCLAQAWGVEEVRCDDPAIPEKAILPPPADGIISTDVLEHVAEMDVEWVLDQIFSLGRRLVFLAVAVLPAKKRLPDGRNAHATVKPADWWTARVAAAWERAEGKPDWELRAGRAEVSCRAR